MQKNYLVKSPIHFADFGFFVKVGDILVHDIGNANRLTVYRNGEIIKAVKQTQLGLAALVKSEFIQEVVQAPSAPKVVPKAPKTSSEPIAKLQGSPQGSPPVKKQGFAEEEFTPSVKRGKAVPKESSTDDPEFRRRMGLDKTI